MTHPLTDQMIAAKDIGMPRRLIGDRFYSNDDLRAVFDLGRDHQLEQVVEWIRECRNYELEFRSECDKMIKDLKKAMRPTNAQEES